MTDVYGVSGLHLVEVSVCSTLSVYGLSPVVLAGFCSERKRSCCCLRAKRASELRKMRRKMEAIKMSEPVCKPPSVITLGNIWRVNVEISFAVTKALTPKEFGQLKRLRDLLGLVTGEVVRWTIGNWRAYSLEVQYSAGLPCFPSTPHIGFLLAHAATAVNIMHSIAKRKAVKSAADIRLMKMVEDSHERLKREYEKPISSTGIE